MQDISDIYWCKVDHKPFLSSLITTSYKTSSTGAGLPASSRFLPASTRAMEFQTIVTVHIPEGTVKTDTPTTLESKGRC